MNATSSGVPFGGNEVASFPGRIATTTDVLALGDVARPDRRVDVLTSL